MWILMFKHNIIAEYCFFLPGVVQHEVYIDFFYTTFARYGTNGCNW